ncbi:YlqD family protein [Alkalicoccobacillus porphyridii]|uniref:YlqD protein n=1 Tax=Alkalicoccobacillus porphyridii TaxID=2597270 RepID=A0A553ZY95_9BACI|nr:YlqD family protein [Alkalicoccobacillus porphyridii]TSB46385.1 hypothetical protein FN960_11300 [Alkalicoccobacillus porphyridii]
MQFLKTVVIKQVLTESKKAELISVLHDEMKQLQRELEQLQFQLHKALRETDSRNEAQVKSRYEHEFTKRKESLSSLGFKYQQLEKLNIGTEIADGQAQAIIELNEGDIWPDQDHSLEMIIRDGRIEQFRESRRSDDGMV